MDDTQETSGIIKSMIDIYPECRGTKLNLQPSGIITLRTKELLDQDPSLSLLSFLLPPSPWACINSHLHSDTILGEKEIFLNEERSNIDRRLEFTSTINPT